VSRAQGQDVRALGDHRLRRTAGRAVRRGQERLPRAPRAPHPPGRAGRPFDRARRRRQAPDRHPLRDPTRLRPMDLRVLPGGRHRPVSRDFSSFPDEALLALLARGDEAALAELYDRYSRVAYGLALRIVRDPSLAEDAVQEAFLTVWRTAGKFTAERAKPSTWILT